MNFATENTLLFLIGFLVIFIFTCYFLLQLVHYFIGRMLVKNLYIWLQGMSLTEPRTKYEIIRQIDIICHDGDFTKVQETFCSVVFNYDIGQLRSEKLVQTHQRKSDDGLYEIAYTLTYPGLQKMISMTSK